MKDYNDFCLDIIGILFVNGIEYNGMLNGLDMEIILDNFMGIIGDDFSMVNQVIVKVFLFMMFLIVVEFELLLVEVVVCGWYFGSVQEYYENGVCVAMKNWECFDVFIVVEDVVIDQYFVDNLFDEGDVMC